MGKSIKIPKSVLELRLVPKKYAKKHGIKLKGKGMSKGQKKRNSERLEKEYSKSAIVGLNKAVKILAENPIEDKKIDKIKDGIDNIISNEKVMKRISRLYKENPKSYPNMIFLPQWIVNTIEYYNQDDLSEEDMHIKESMNNESLIAFCTKLLKSKIKRYKNLSDVSDVAAFHLASVAPTSKLFRNNRNWYRKLLDALYKIAENEAVDVPSVLDSVRKIDEKKKDRINKDDFYRGFFSEFIRKRVSNKNHTFTDYQKDLHENLIDGALKYLDQLKSSKCKDILKSYIKSRKAAESDKRDSKRVIKFIDHAHSNSPYVNLKAAIQDLITADGTAELYLS